MSIDARRVRRSIGGLTAPPVLGVGLPPVRQRAFWAVQALVLVIAVAHTLLETVGRMQLPLALYLVPSSLFFVPVVYAALKFGARGAVPTALWSVVLTIPNLVFLHQGLDRIGVLWQSTILMAIGAFVGVAVDHERDARAEVEARETARQASERRYRALYDRAVEAVLVVDDDWRVEEANAAASRLLEQDPASMRGRDLEEVVGPQLAADLRAGSADADPRPVPSRSGSPIWVQAMGAAPLSGEGEGGGSQLMLHDVTLQFERQRGLEAWARHAIAAREEERRRIGRELHDGPLQSLVLLLRKLDSIAREGVRGEVLVEAEEIINETAAELRRLSRALRPPILDDLGLVAAVRSEANGLARRSAIATTCEVIGDQHPLAEETELLILRITQESLHNVERHSGATSVAITLSFEPGRARLVVADDGRGIGSVPSVPSLMGQGKLGIVGMFERVRLMHGTIGLSDRPGGGTTVTVEVPTPPRVDPPRPSA